MSFLKITLASLVFIALTAGAQTTASNLGFIQNNIWFSKEPFFEGDTVRVYSAVFNGSSEDVTGAVEFYANDKLIGADDFSITSGGKVREVWVDWRVTGGNQTVRAVISKAYASKAGEAPRPVTVEHATTGEATRFVDIDTDKDGIGNKTDTDDDSDGITDIAESSVGTNPLVKDAPVVPATTTAGKAEQFAKDAAGKAQELAGPALEIADSFVARQVASLRSKEASLVNEIVGLENPPIIFGPESALDMAIKDANISINKEALLSDRTKKQFELALVRTAIVALENPLIRYGVLGVLLFLVLKFMVKRLMKRRNREE